MHSDCRPHTAVSESTDPTTRFRSSPHTLFCVILYITHTHSVSIWWRCVVFRRWRCCRLGVSRRVLYIYILNDDDGSQIRRKRCGERINVHVHRRRRSRRPDGNFMINTECYLEQTVGILIFSLIRISHKSESPLGGLDTLPVFG